MMPLLLWDKRWNDGEKLHQKKSFQDLHILHLKSLQFPRMVWFYKRVGRCGNSQKIRIGYKVVTVENLYKGSIRVFRSYDWLGCWQDFLVLKNAFDDFIF